MAKFIVNKNKQSNGDREVHNATKGCSYMPNSENQVEIGHYDTCQEAVIKAKVKLSDNRVNGCYYCCNTCHTS